MVGQEIEDWGQIVSFRPGTVLRPRSVDVRKVHAELLRDLPDQLRRTES